MVISSIQGNSMLYLQTLYYDKSRTTMHFSRNAPRSNHLKIAQGAAHRAQVPGKDVHVLHRGKCANAH